MHAVMDAALAYRALTLLLLGLVLAALTLLTSKRAPHDLRMAQVVLRWFLLGPVGLGFAWTAAQVLLQAGGDALQLQLGLAALGFAAVGVAAAWGGVGMRLAALIGPSVWIVGGLLAHGAAFPGAPVVSDLLVPVVGFALLLWQYRAQRHRSVFARSRL